MKDATTSSWTRRSSRPPRTTRLYPLVCSLTLALASESRGGSPSSRHLGSGGGFPHPHDADPYQEADNARVGSTTASRLPLEDHGCIGGCHRPTNDLWKE